MRETSMWARLRLTVSFLGDDLAVHGDRLVDFAVLNGDL